MEKLVYFFAKGQAEGSAKMKDLLGGKGANLAEMTAIGIPKPGGPEALIAEQRPLPKPGPREILIKVAAAGVNRPDVAQRTGNYPPPAGASLLGLASLLLWISVAIAGRMIAYT